MLSCRGRRHSHSVCGRASRGLSAAQRLVGIAAEEWLQGYGCHWSMRRCVVRFLLVDTLDIFGNALRVRHLLGDRGAVAESTCEAFCNDWSARVSA
ncbi:hypothetical protein TcBrA4_0107900 [Trypanosoma cruzi]|nr:hypothetical protein TcBrA4_0107900 [Trypanosoma cruzi]